MSSYKDVAREGMSGIRVAYLVFSGPRDFARDALLADKSKPGETLGRKATGRPRHETTAGLPGGNPTDSALVERTLLGRLSERAHSHG